MRRTQEVIDPRLEEKRRRLVRPSKWFWLLATVLAVPGLVLIIVGTGWVFAVGWVLIALGASPLVIAVALSAAGMVGWWAARGKPFA
jgi:hypothetical protein